MADLTAERLEELERLEREATAGPWGHVAGHGVGGAGSAVHCLGDDGPPDVNTRMLIAMRNELPALLAMAKRLLELDAAFAHMQKFMPQKFPIDADELLETAKAFPGWPGIREQQKEQESDG